MEHRWKRYLSGMLCLVMVLSMLPVSVMAEGVMASGTCGESLTWSLTEAGELIISGVGAMDDYDLSSKAPWYDYCADIKTAVVEAGVTCIGSYAFCYCSKLVSVVLPEGLSSIGSAAFYYCSGLTGVTLPEGSTSIGGSAFGYCSALTSIAIPGSVTKIGGKAFVGCSDLQGIWVDPENQNYCNDDRGVLFDYDRTTLLWAPDAMTGAYRVPESVTGIGEAAFEGCSGLTGVTLPEGVTRIGEWAFAHCTGLTDVTLPESVTSIGGSAFYCCIDLISVTLPGGVTGIGEWMFGHCYDLTSVIMPKGVTSIGNYAFYNCSKLPGISLPEGLTSIGYRAFQNCSVLGDVYYGGTEEQWSLIAIDSDNAPLLEARVHIGGTDPHVFETEGVAPTCTKQGYTKHTCTGCGYVYTEDYVDAPGHSYSSQVVEPTLDTDGYTLYTCMICGDSYTDQETTDDVIEYDSCGEGVSWRLTEAGVLVIFGDGAMEDYYDASSVPWDSYRGDIRSVVVGPGVTGIGGYAFDSCSSLTSVTLPAGVTSIGDRIFADCDSLISVSLPEGLTWIGSSVFEGCSSLTEMTLPEGLTDMGYYVFAYCDGLTSVTLPKGLTEIGYDTFAYCDSLTTVTLPEGLTSIGGSAFYYCSSLTAVTLPEGLTSIGYDAFGGCSSLTSVTIPKSVTEIGESVFGDCTVLQGIWVDPDNQNYASDAFGVLFDKQKTVLIQAPGAIAGAYAVPKGVTSIESCALEDCSGLTSVTLPEGLTSIGDLAFFNCTSLTGVTLPEGLTKIGGSAFEGCSSLTGVTIPGSVTSIGSGAFYRCDALKGIWVDPENAKYHSDAYGVLFNKAETTLIQAPGAITGAYCVPESVTSIGFKSFAYCDGLTGVTLPEGLAQIESHAFEDCSSLTDVTLPKGLTSIGSGAFYKCSSLTSATLPEALTKIQDWTFAACTSLVSVVLPEGLTKVGSYGFYSCNKLSDVYYGGTEEQWAAISISSNNTPLTKATIHFGGVCTHSYEAETVAPSCTEQGYTVYTCADCGDSYIDGYVDATGHSYENGACTICGAEDPDAVKDPGLTLEYPTLSFEDEIFYNVYFTVDDMTSVEELGLMLLSSNDADATIDDAIGTVPGYVTNGTMYLVKSEGIAAANMGDTVYFKVYAKLTDGSYAYSGAGGYSAKAYTSTVLSGDYSDAMKALVVAMVEYGAEAQKFFGHNTDKLADAVLTEEQKALVAAYDETMVDDVVPADSTKTANFVRVNSNFKTLYPSVSFDGAFSINYYCTPAITVDDGMTLYYWDSETYDPIAEFTVDNATGSMEMTATNGQYWGNVAGIAAKDMDKTYYVSCVFESEGETITTGIIAYSLGKYCESKATTDGDAQQAFAQATAVYGYYAKQYFEGIA